MKFSWGKIIGLLMMLILLGGMFHCDMDCGQDNHCAQDCGCQTHCAIAIITPPPDFAPLEGTERLPAATPRVPDFSLHSAIFRPPIA